MEQRPADKDIALAYRIWVQNINIYAYFKGYLKGEMMKE